MVVQRLHIHHQPHRNWCNRIDKLACLEDVERPWCGKHGPSCDEVSEECLDWYSQNRKECFENVTFVVCGDVVIHWNSEGRFGLSD